MEGKAGRHVATMQEGLWGEREGQQDAKKHASEILHRKRESLEASLFGFLFFSLMVVASQGAARMRCKMAMPLCVWGFSSWNHF